MDPIYEDYLDTLRESGLVNMFLAPRYLAEEFGLSKAEAIKIVKEWARNVKRED